jgi:hypothetical protein
MPIFAHLITKNWTIWPNFIYMTHLANFVDGSNALNLAKALRFAYGGLNRRVSCATHDVQCAICYDVSCNYQYAGIPAKATAKT